MTEPAPLYFLYKKNFLESDSLRGLLIPMTMSAIPIKKQPISG